MAKRIAPTTKEEAISQLLPFVKRQIQGGSQNFLKEGYNPHPAEKSVIDMDTVVLRFLDASGDYYFWVKIKIPWNVAFCGTHSEDWTVIICTAKMHPLVRNYARFIHSELVAQGKNKLQILGNFLTPKIISEETSDNLNEMASELTPWMEGEME